MAEDKDDETTEKSGIKPAQVIAAALAAITAAFLGSTLGVGGTVIGAGVASVVTTVGGEVYLRSLRKTREAALKTKEVLALTDTRLRQDTRLVEPPPEPPTNPLVRPGFEEPTVFLPRPDVAEPKAKKPWWKSRWTLAVGTSVAAFVVGMLAITGFETLTGNAVSGNGGTTVGQIVGGTGGSSTTTVTTTTITETPSSTSEAPVTTTTQSEAPTTTTTTDAPSTASSSASATPTESASPSSG